MQKWLSEGFSWKFALVLCVLVGLAYHFLVLERARVDLKIVTKTECNFKIYWAEAGQDFAEKRMARIRISPGLEQYNLSMRSLKNIERLRIDTHDFTGTVALKHLVITQPGHKLIRMVSESALKRMKPKNDVKNFTLVKGGVKIESSGNDPTFKVTLYPGEVQAAICSCRYLQMLLAYRPSETLSTGLRVWVRQFVQQWPQMSMTRLTQPSNIWSGLRTRFSPMTRTPLSTRR